VKLIVAMDSKGGIGKDGSIPWYFPQDLKYFQQMTLNNACVMGKLTYYDIYEKINQPLPNRLNIVMTKGFNMPVQSQLVSFCRDYESIIKLKDTLLKGCFIVGGAEIYKLFMPYITEAYITRVQGDYNCDTFMPEIPETVKIIERFLDKEGNFIS